MLFGKPVISSDVAPLEHRPEGFHPVGMDFTVNILPYAVFYGLVIILNGNRIIPPMDQ